MKQGLILLLLACWYTGLHAQNVGIGKTNPATKLDIGNGRLRFSGQVATNTASGIEFTDATGNALSGFFGTLNDSTQGFYGFMGSGWSFLHNNKNGHIGLQGNTDPRAPLSFNNYTGNKLALFGNANLSHYGMGIQGFQMQYYTDAPNADLAFGYGSSGAFNENVRFTGDGTVGIGNSNPQKAGLIVDKRIGATSALFGSNTTGVSIQASYPGIGFNTYYSNATRFIGTGYGGLISFDPNIGEMGFFTSTSSGTADNGASLSKALSITAAGNVGIGNITPGTKLHVAGSIRMVDGNQGAGKVMVSTANGTAAWSHATRSEVISYGPTDFMALSSDQPIITGAGDEGAYFSDPRGATLKVPIHLPQGAVLTEMTIVYKDNIAANLEIGWGFNDLNAAGNTTYALLNTSGASPGWRSDIRTANSLSALTIDNANYSYWMYAYSAGWPGTSSLSIRSIMIRYTYPASN